jgi:hypothetical protein
MEIGKRGGVPERTMEQEWAPGMKPMQAFGNRRGRVHAVGGGMTHLHASPASSPDNADS